MPSVTKLDPTERSRGGAEAETAGEEGSLLEEGTEVRPGQGSATPLVFGEGSPHVRSLLDDWFEAVRSDEGMSVEEFRDITSAVSSASPEVREELSNMIEMLAETSPATDFEPELLAFFHLSRSGSGG